MKFGILSLNWSQFMCMKLYSIWRRFGVVIANCLALSLQSEHGAYQRDNKKKILKITILLENQNEC